MKRRNKNFKKRSDNSLNKLSLFQKNDGKFSKKCPLSMKDAPEINYKNISLLKKYVSDNNKIISGKITSVGLGVGYWVLIVLAAILVIGGLGYFFYYAFNKGFWRSATSAASGGASSKVSSGSSKYDSPIATAVWFDKNIILNIICLK